MDAVNGDVHSEQCALSPVQRSTPRKHASTWGWLRLFRRSPDGCRVCWTSPREDTAYCACTPSL
eukprot:232810-Chlamydomonas_euryale.AAC.5